MNEQIQIIIDEAREVSAIIRDMVPPSGRLVRGSPQMVTVKRAIESAASVDAVCDALEAAERRAEMAEARTLEDEQLRLRLAGDLAMEKRQHETIRSRLGEAHREVDGLRAERASVDAGVCQSCASAWWAREHDQQAAKEQVAAAEASLRAERARASAAQVVTNAAVRDLTSAAGEIMLLREKLAAAEQDRDEVVTLLGEIRELARTRSCGPAVHDDLWAIKELADSFILRNAAPGGAAPAEAP